MRFTVSFSSRVMLSLALAFPAAGLADVTQQGSVDLQRTAQVDEQGRSAAMERVVALELEDVPLAEAIEDIARRAGLRLTYSRAMLPADRRVSVDARRITVADAVARVLQGTDLELVVTPMGQAALVRREPPTPGENRQGVIAGRVTSAATQEPLPGVTVTVVDTRLRALTGPTGAYRIADVPAGTHLLRTGLIGYAAQEESVTVSEGQTTTVDFELEPAPVMLDELVAVGYGTERARTLAGSVASVSAEQLRDIPLPNATTLLQGKLPGVVVNNFSAQPGRDDGEIRIRGVGTLNAGQNPLVIIDGVTASVTELGQIPPGDIADVTVLKDAASAAIYGARAANGVILVQTQHGARETRPQVTFRSTFTQQRPLVDLDLLDSWDYAGTVNEWQVAEGSEALYTDEMIQAMRDGSDPDRFANTDWYGEVVRPAPMQEYYLAVTGGSGPARYRLSSEYRDQDGIMRGTEAKQFSIRSNVDVDLGTRARASLSVSGYREDVTQPSVVSAQGIGDSSVFYQVRRFAKPTVPVKYSNGEWGVVDGLYPDWGFPITNVMRAVGLGENEDDEYQVMANLSGEVDLLDNLVVQSRFSGTYNSSVWTQFWPTSQAYDWAGDLVSNDPTNALSNDNNTSYQLLNANTVTYTPELGRHRLTLMGGQSVEFFRQDYLFAHAEGFPSDDVRELTAGVENLDVNGWAQDNSLFSMFGRASYDYDERYLFQANLRYDGSSRFADENRFALFPSFAAGWVVSSESFMQNVDPISFLKLRGGWGRLGNQEIGNYPYVQTYATGHNYIIGGELVGGAAIDTLANRDISWETTTITDLGFDLHLLDSRLTFVADYFDKRTTDILVRLPIPANQGGVTAPFQNVGEVQNAGWELAATYNHTFSPDAGIEAGFNISRVRNKVLDLGKRGDTELGGWIDGNTVVVEGQPIGAYYGYMADGFFQTQEEVDNHATQFGNLAPGDIRFRDLNGDGAIDPENDRTIIGQPFPDFSYGITLGGRYKGFTVNTFLQGVHGIERFNWYNNELTAASSFTRSVLDRWTEDNRDGTFPRFGNWANNNEMSSYWLDDASYLRLKHVQISYTLPEALTQRLAMQGMRLHLAGYNLLTFTSIEEFDPEKASADHRNWGYPGLKNFAIGLEVTP